MKQLLFFLLLFLTCNAFAQEQLIVWNNGFYSQKNDSFHSTKNSNKDFAQPLVEAGKFVEIYDPRWYQKEHWSVNDHTFMYGKDKRWHVFGITHPVPLNWYTDPGKNLFHATADSLTQSRWKMEPFAVTANPEKYGEYLLWAPHVIKNKRTYYMFVCVGNKEGHNYKIHLLTSKDLWKWNRAPENPMVVDGFDGRDPCVLKLDTCWIMYYTATSSPEGGNHIVAAVTSKDLKHWTNRRVVFTHTSTGTFAGPTESPFIVQRGKKFYLFVCDGGVINVYQSENPLFWDKNNHVGAIYAHASEIVRDLNGKWYISHAGWERGGLSIAPLIWHDGMDNEKSSIQPGE